MTPHISVVILNWNGRDDTLACLASVERISYPAMQVIVVDNGSSDDSAAAIRRAFPRVELIETQQNLGFAGGNNVGIRRALEAGADYVLLLNNDTEVDEELLNAFLEAAQRHPDAGAFSGKIYFHADPTRIWYAGARWNAEATCFDHVGEGMIDRGAVYSTGGETAYACGCALFVSAPRLREVGLLDEDFFLYFEETDWCYRAKARGYPSFFIPEAKLWHKVSVSFGGEGSPLALYFITRNRLLWASRHAPMRTRLRIYGSSVSGLFRRFGRPIIDAILKPPFSLRAARWTLEAVVSEARNRAYWLGWRDFWLRRLGNCPDEVRELTQDWKALRASANGNIPAAVRQR